MAKEELLQFEGLVTEILPDAHCRIQLNNIRPAMPLQGFDPIHSSGDVGDELMSIVCFSNRPVGVKRFQTIHDCGVDVARGLVLLYGIGT